MRIYEDRYHRERQRFHVALRFIRLEARTHTIRYWTGLTDDRIRKLYRSYLADSADRLIRRHRGKSPQRTTLFLRSARLREQSALLASLFRLLLKGAYLVGDLALLGTERFRRDHRQRPLHALQALVERPVVFALLIRRE